MSFSTDLDRFKKSLMETSEKAVSDIIVELVDDITELTPKETGAAASNWQAGERESDHFDEDDMAWQANREEQKKKSKELSKRFIRKKQDVVISNAAPYIIRLERGTSKEAPAGMVKVAVMRAKSRRTT